MTCLCHGLGAPLSYVMDGGQERTIAYAPRILSSSETNCATILEALSTAIFDVKKISPISRRAKIYIDHRS